MMRTARFRPAPLSPPSEGRVGRAPGYSSLRPGAPLSLTLLSMRDEEIVLRSRAGELPHAIARALGHDLLDVMRALNRAIALGIPIRPFTTGERA